MQDMAALKEELEEANNTAKTQKEELDKANNTAKMQKEELEKANKESKMQKEELEKANKESKTQEHLAFLRLKENGNLQKKIERLHAKIEELEARTYVSVEAMFVITL